MPTAKAMVAGHSDTIEIAHPIPFTRTINTGLSPTLITNIAETYSFTSMVMVQFVAANQATMEQSTMTNNDKVIDIWKWRPRKLKLCAIPLMVTPTQNEKNEWATLAQAAYRAQFNDIGTDRRRNREVGQGGPSGQHQGGVGCQPSR
jgi:hypothetical protein